MLRTDHGRLALGPCMKEQKYMSDENDGVHRVGPSKSEASRALGLLHCLSRTLVVVAQHYIVSISPWSIPNYHNFIHRKFVAKSIDKYTIVDLHGRLARLHVM